MQPVSDEQFHEYVDRAFDRLPEVHRGAIQNVAILVSDEPTQAQRKTLRLRCDQTLLGLYEGVPLSKRQGLTNVFQPDIITLFKQPILSSVSTVAELEEQIYHTLWHEVAHYFGLDHDDIHRLEA